MKIKHKLILILFVFFLHSCESRNGLYINFNINYLGNWVYCERLKPTIFPIKFVSIDSTIFDYEGQDQYSIEIRYENGQYLIIESTDKGFKYINRITFNFSNAMLFGKNVKIGDRLSQMSKPYEEDGLVFVKLDDGIYASVYSLANKDQANNLNNVISKPDSFYIKEFIVHPNCNW